MLFIQYQYTIIRELNDFVNFQVARESIQALNQREIELNDLNKVLIASIEKKEKKSIQEVDGILRKYEKYQVLKMANFK